MHGAGSTIAAVKVLLVSFYWPPAGGGGVQRPLKLAQYLPALGIETHVLAPGRSALGARRPRPARAEEAWVHRARYVGPSGRKPAEELPAAGRCGRRALGHARLFGRRLLVPDENVVLERDGDPGCDPARARARDRRGDHYLAAELRASRRRRRAEGDRHPLARRPARLRRRAPAPARRERSRAGEREGGRGASRGSSRAAPTRSRASRRRSPTRSARSGPAVWSRRSRTAATSTTSPGSTTARPTVPHHPRGQLLRQARPAAVPAGRRTTQAST